MASPGEPPTPHCGLCRPSRGIKNQDSRPQTAKSILAEVVVFFLPLVLALIGAVALSPLGTTSGVLGGIGGIVLGLFGAALVRRWMNRRRQDA